MATNVHHQVLIVGGGAAGITVAAELTGRATTKVDIAIIEPSTVHYYQPAFTLVGAGVSSLASTRRQEESLIPPGIAWIKDAASGFEPDANAVLLASGARATYDYLIVCPGLQLNFGAVQGLTDTIGRNNVCSNYSPQYVEYTWECVRQLRPGAKALFTQAPLPFKCPGAPQKIAYLTADHLRKQGALDSSKVTFCTHAPAIFAVPIYAKELVKVAQGYGIDVRYQHNLVAVDGPNHKATFKIVGGEKEGQTVEMEFDMLHVTPPQSAPDFVRSSPLANAAGFVEVHQNSLQHVKYKNVFGLGDACSTPNSKTAAAVRKQSPVVVRNVLALMRAGAVEEGYDGYASCPLTTAYGKVLMAEFIYGGKPTPTFPLDPRVQRGVWWWCKTTGLPLMYWHYMLRGHVMFPRHDATWAERHPNA
jgi:sulfide:quinone oxidoreductase